MVNDPLENAPVWRREVRPDMIVQRRRNPFAFCLLIVGACATIGHRNTDDTRFAQLARTLADSLTTELIAPGVQLHRLVKNSAPWRVVLLDVDLSKCVDVRAVKGTTTALGRATTSALLTSIAPTLRAVAAVNADFFLFTPPGVPVGAHIEDGRVLSGPIDRPVFAMLPHRKPWIGKLTISAQLHTTRGDIAIPSWNRPSAKTTGVVDAAWGIPLDSTVRAALTLVPIARSRGEQRYLVSPFDRARNGVVTGDTLLLVGISALPAASRSATTNSATSLYIGDTVTVSRTMSPVIPIEAVGGQPVLLRDSQVVGAVDSVNNAAFRALNPRTAIAYGNNGRRLMIAVIDGRQPNYSMGMSLRDMANLFRALGATDAINLDGGGSSAMAINDPRAPNGHRLANHPSDSVGERPVANALAVLRSCK